MEDHLVSALSMLQRSLNGKPDREALVKILGNTVLLAKAESNEEFTINVMKVIKEWMKPQN